MNIVKARFRDAVEIENGNFQLEWNALLFPGTSIKAVEDAVMIHDKTGSLACKVPMDNVAFIRYEAAAITPVQKPAPKTKKQPAKKVAGKAKPR